MVGTARYAICMTVHVGPRDGLQAGHFLGEEGRSRSAVNLVHLQQRTAVILKSPLQYPNFLDLPRCLKVPWTAVPTAVLYLTHPRRPFERIFQSSPFWYLPPQYLLRSSLPLILGQGRTDDLFQVILMKTTTERSARTTNHHY